MTEGLATMRWVLDPLAVWIAAAWLAVLLLHAGLAKAMDRMLLVQHLGAYRVPDAWIWPLAWLLPAAELLCGVLLLSPWRPVGAAGAAVLLLLYAGAMAWHLAAGRQLDCGCGGEPLPLSWALVMRNGALLLLCGLAAASMAERELRWADQAVVLGAVLLGALLWAAFHQVLRQMRRTSVV
jgi:uncharacterized membrane protein YphA (DoxX/SURF4 family)